MIDTVHFVQVSGKIEADLFAESLEERGIGTDDNVVIIDKQVQPLDREEVLYFLEEMARTLDVAEEMNIDWEKVYNEDAL